MLVGKLGVTMSGFQDARLMKSPNSVIEGDFRPPIQPASLADIAVDMHSDGVRLSERV